MNRSAPWHWPHTKLTGGPSGTVNCGTSRPTPADRLASRSASLRVGVSAKLERDAAPLCGVASTTATSSASAARLSTLCDSSSSGSIEARDPLRRSVRRCLRSGAEPLPASNSSDSPLFCLSTRAMRTERRLCSSCRSRSSRSFRSKDPPLATKLDLLPDDFGDVDRGDRAARCNPDARCDGKHRCANLEMAARRSAAGGVAGVDVVLTSDRHPPMDTTRPFFRTLPEAPPSAPAPCAASCCSESLSSDASRPSTSPTSNVMRRMS